MGSVQLNLFRPKTQEQQLRELVPKVIAYANADVKNVATAARKALAESRLQVSNYGYALRRLMGKTCRKIRAEKRKLK